MLSLNLHFEASDKKLEGLDSLIKSHEWSWYLN